MNPERIGLTFKVLNTFITNSLALKLKQDLISASMINSFLISSCAYQTYLETICNKSDTIYRYIKNVEESMITFSYLDFIKQISRKINLKEKKVVLAFDYTKETFWGEVNGFDIIGTKKSEKGTGAFKFLTCSQVSGKIHAKIPLISIPVGIGHNKAHAISHCLSLIKDKIGEIELILFDREFYVKDIMMTLNELKIHYLIFVPKKKGIIKDTLNDMFVGETQTQTYKFDVNKNKTIYKNETTMTFLKQIFDGKSYQHFDWCFVTNILDFEVNKMIPTYKCRWRIETGFRVQDEANCKTKSREMIIRYFMFIYEQLLQSIWYTFYKKEEKVSFKQFIITLNNRLQDIEQFEGSKVHVNTN